jgi:endonuclease G
MAPAGDMKYNLTTYQESFLLSNVSPQNHELNTGLWRRIEEKVRKWQKRDGKLWVVTGPVLRKGLPTIGENKVAIPDAYFKILLDIQSSEPKMIGFYVANKNSTFSMEKFVVSIDKIEAETGLDFFYQLPDSLENRLEANITARKWFAN